MKNQYASTILTINLQAVRDNYAILKSKAPKAKISAVVKADAYGLGVAEISKTLAKEGCDTFFVANLDEALALRKLLPKATIFVLHGIEKGQEKVFLAHKITPILNSMYQINLWQQYSVKQEKKLPCILHFDTGMNRLGLELRAKGEGKREKGGKLKINSDDGEIHNSENFFPLPSPFSLRPIYIMSHLACSDEKSHPKNAEQLAQFQEIAKNFKGTKLSLANSGGVFLGSKYHFDLVRPGIALYGGNPTASKNPMKNVINLSSKILQIHQVDRAGTVGYGAERKLAVGTKIATIAVGYADGYLRSLSNNGVCAVDGVLVPVIGRVSMDLVTLDVTKIPDEKLAKLDVEIVGDNIPVDVVAEKAGTISYEILTSLGARYKRIYLSS